MHLLRAHAAHAILTLRYAARVQLTGHLDGRLAHTHGASAEMVEGRGVGGQ